jgi:hypothetical protein
MPQIFEANEVLRKCKIHETAYIWSEKGIQIWWLKTKKSHLYQELCHSKTMYILHIPPHEKEKENSCNGFRWQKSMPNIRWQSIVQSAEGASVSLLKKVSQLLLESHLFLFPL